MIIRKNILYALVAFICLVAISGFVLFFFLNSITQITTVDNSNKYNLSYNKNDNFNNQLTKLGIRKKNFATVDGFHFFTLNRLVIEIVDQNQDHYQRKDPVTKSILSSSSISQEKNTLHIKVYLSSKMAMDYSNEYLSQAFLSQVLISLHSSLGNEKISPEEALDRAGASFAELSNKKSVNIFQISAQK